MESKDESERAQGLRLKSGHRPPSTHYLPHLLTTRQIGDVLPALLRRHYAKYDALGEWIKAINEFKLGISPQCDHLQCRSGIRRERRAKETLTWYISLIFLDMPFNLDINSSSLCFLSLSKLLFPAFRPSSLP